MVSHAIHACQIKLCSLVWPGSQQAVDRYWTMAQRLGTPSLKHNILVQVVQVGSETCQSQIFTQDRYAKYSGIKMSKGQKVPFRSSQIAKFCYQISLDMAQLCHIITLFQDWITFTTVRRVRKKTFLGYYILSSKHGTYFCWRNLYAFGGLSIKCVLESLLTENTYSTSCSSL